MILINAAVYRMDAPTIDNGYIDIKNGYIAEVGEMSDCETANDSEVIDLNGKKVLPGFIDAHTHLGMWEDGLGFEGDDGNEDTDPSTPHMRALDAINPNDRCFSEALKAGVTTVVTGPGSTNPVAGELLAMKTHGRRIDEMVIKSPIAMKFSLGENPKTVYHGKNLAPVTRMATAAIIREQLYKARRYLKSLNEAEENGELEKPEYDIKCEALLPVLNKSIPVHFHAHRLDDIHTAMRIAEEFDLEYVIVHGTQSYKDTPFIAQKGVKILCGPLICDRSKPELKDLTPAAPGILEKAGISLAIVTDHPVVPVQYLPLCAGLAAREGMDPMAALRSITWGAASILGLSNIGAIRKGMDADLLVFKDDPLSLNGKPEFVFVNGKRVV